MSGIREHKAYKVRWVKKEHTGAKTFNEGLVIAPSDAIAEAWVRSQFGFDELISCDSEKITAFIQEHIW